MNHDNDVFDVPPPPTDEVPVRPECPDDPTDEVVGDLPPVDGAWMQPDENVEPTRDLPPEVLTERLGRMDDFLGRWRNETVERRSAWDEEQERLDAALLARRRRVGLAAVVGAVPAVAIPLVVWTASLLQSAPSEARATSTAPAPASQVAVEPREVPPAPEPVEAVEEPEGSPAPVAAPAPPAPDPVVDALGIASEPRTWQAQGYVWTELDVSTLDHVQLAWVDPTGAEVLERMSCVLDDDGGRHCRAGRSARRVRHALSQGAVAGTWTVQACHGDLCTPVGTFEAPLP